MPDGLDPSGKASSRQENSQNGETNNNVLTANRVGLG